MRNYDFAGKNTGFCSKHVISFGKNTDFAWKSSEKALKKLEIPSVFADSAPKTAKFIWFFDEKRPRRDPKLCATRQADMGIHLGTIGLSREQRKAEKTTKNLSKILIML